MNLQLNNKKNYPYRKDPSSVTNTIPTTRGGAKPREGNLDVPFLTSGEFKIPTPVALPFVV